MKPGAAAAALLAAALLAARPLSALATGADFLDAGVPARPAALAGAFAADNDDPSAFLWNPGALGLVPEPMLSVTHFLSILDTEYDQASYAEPLKVWGADAGLGLGMQYDTTANFEQVDAQGNDVGLVENYDLLVEGAAGLSLLPGLRLGAGGKVFDSDLDAYHARGYAADLGGQYDLTRRLTLGAALENLGAEGAFDQVADALPTKLSFAGRWMALDTDLNTLQLSAEADRYWSQYDPGTVGVGGEYWYAQTLAFRLGWLFGAQGAPLSIGVGLRWQSLRLDYSYGSLGDLGTMNRFSLTVALGSLFRKLGWTVAPIQGSRPPAPDVPARVQAP